MKAIEYRDLGVVEYVECWQLQHELFEAAIAAKSRGDVAAQVVLLCEHPHVYTLGKSGQRDNMLIDEEMLERIGAKYIFVDRGGDITYHGPGQLVGYPILDLDAFGLGLRRYIEIMEQAIIDTIGELGLHGCRVGGASGVWLEADGKRPRRKICAIGVRSSQFVTMHGFALNVSTELEYFSHINPCGFVDYGVTSIEKEIGAEVDMERVKEIFRSKFGVLIYGDPEEDYKC